MESNPSADTHLPDTGMRPVQSLIWKEITSFVGRIKARAGFATCDLPTEAQWEYACRAGTTGPHAGPVVKMAWCWYEGNFLRGCLLSAVPVSGHFRQLCQSGF
jgi:formylglycine-generating enzyme required for sulfatase activity